MLVNCYSRESAEALRSEAHALAVIGLNDPINRQFEHIIPSGLLSTEASDYVHELWQITNTPLVNGISGRCKWAESGGFLFTSISLTEDECQDLVESTKQAYKELLEFISKTEQPHLLRFWNYVPAINNGLGDNENYKLFCTGRLKAFEESNVKNEDFPAATGVGNRTSGMTIYAISSQYKGQHHANHKQQNAYQYPRQYGISSPSFARATTLEYPDGKLLFISGTASIIGHETLHCGDLVGQLEVTKDNINHLLENTGYANDSIQTMKVYLRESSYLEKSREILDHYFPSASKIYTIADICRADLMVEVECFCT